MIIVSRLAPSPTGVLHLGNVRTFLWAWLSARAQNGKVILRIEDLETRGKPGVTERMLDDLIWLGLDWDEGPRLPLDASSAPYIQSQRRETYKQAHAQLAAAGAIYPCTCSRADIAAAQSAPHEGDVEPRYPGTCRGKYATERDAQLAIGDSARQPAWRLIVPPGEVAFDDLLYGMQRIDVATSVGDFVVAKAPDNPAYQLAVAADDIAMGVNEVVRGDDLIPSTARQMLIYRALGAADTIPRYGHVPLVVGPDGKRLAKRHGDARISSFRERGLSARRIIGVLARWSGLHVSGDVSAKELLPLWSWKAVSKERVILTPERLAEFT